LGDGHFYALDRATGRVKWRLAAGRPEALSALGDYALAAPAAYDGLVYLCGPDGVVSAVDAYTGQSIWTVATGGMITSSPAVAEGIVYFGSRDEHIYALEAKTGAVAWKRHVGAPVALPVAVGDDRLFAVTELGVLWAVDGHTGAVAWKVSGVGEQAPMFAEVVVLAGGTALDPANGQVLWEVDAGGAIPVARQDQVIYPGGVVDLFTGALRLEHPDSPQAASGEQQEAAAERVVTDVPEEAGERAVVPPPGLPVRLHTVAGALAVGVGADQRLYAWNPDDRQPVWIIELGAHCHQPPGIAPGQVVLAMADGSLRTYRFNG
ncbi:MAG: hypothetical protein JWN15_1353, partial [Firmicutes bacterium]|nr:hypothetical protein [Bacillota bacterium]